MNEDILTLQEIVAHQAVQIEELSEALYAQQKDNNALREEFAQLQAQFKQLLDFAATQQGDNSGYTTGYEPPPPHY